MKILSKNNNTFIYLLLQISCLLVFPLLYAQDSIPITQTILSYSTDEDDILDLGLSLGNMFNLDVKV